MGGSAMGGSRKHGSHTCSGRHYARADAVAVLRRIKASDVDQRVEASRGRHACRRRGHKWLSMPAVDLSPISRRRLTRLHILVHLLVAGRMQRESVRHRVSG